MIYVTKRDELTHYGIKFRSGRYKWGSGEDSHQRWRKEGKNGQKKKTKPSGTYVNTELFTRPVSKAGKKRLMRKLKEQNTKPENKAENSGGQKNKKNNNQNNQNGNNNEGKKKDKKKNNEDQPNVHKSLATSNAYVRNITTSARDVSSSIFRMNRMEKDNDISVMSDADLRKKVERMRLEQSYYEAVNRSTSAKQEKVDKMISLAGNITTTGMNAYGLYKSIKEIKQLG